MAGAEGSVLALIAAAFFFLWLGDELGKKEGNLLAALKPLNMAIAYICLMVATYVGSTFLAANAAAKGTMELLFSLLAIVGFIIVFVAGINWVWSLFMDAWMGWQNKKNGFDR